MLCDDNVMKDISEGIIKFDKLICTKEYLQDLKKFARILGPKGLMPNVKSGTLVPHDELIEQVKQSKQGLIEFKVTQDSQIMTKLGLRSFDTDKIE